jgi:RNA polymerase sigma-70 factor (ECF subfamily)
MTQELITLVDQAKSGNDLAFSKLYKQYKGLIRYIIYGIVRNIDLTDDLVADTFAKAYSKLNTYTDHISFEMWLKTIAVNNAIDFIRHTKREKYDAYIDDEDNPIQLPDNVIDPEDEYAISEMLDRALKTIPTLKKEYRDLLNARIDNMSYKDIAIKFGLKENTVKCILNKARQKLKQKINY